MICKLCNVDKPKLIGDWEGKKFSYLDELNNKWHGRICPSCIPSYHKEYRKPKLKPKRVAKCQACSKEFIAQGSTHRYCSSTCLRLIASRKQNAKKVANRVVTCITCAKVIIGRKRKYCTKACAPKPRYTTKTKQIKKCKQCASDTTRYKYCSSKCQRRYRQVNGLRRVNKNAPGYKRTKRNARMRRKMKQANAMPSWVSYDNLYIIYDSCPKNFQIDHIIPLNHPDVCGLHVPWNLQHLSAEDNNLKSNSFDYTNDNLSWLLLRAA